MTWADDIDHALQRGGSQLSFLDIFYAVRKGCARLRIETHMHGGVMVWPDTKVAELTHVCGHWGRDEAEGLLAWAERSALEMGATSFELTGRPGWRRFLEREGIDVSRWK